MKRSKRIEYLFQGKLDNTVHDITYDQIGELYEDNLKEAEESSKMTASSYRGENFYNQNGNFHYELFKEYLERDPRTAGMRVYYPHGVIIEQSARRNYYRGENQIFPESLPTLQRSLKKYETVKERELYRLVADMRIAEFSFFLNNFKHVQNWNQSDVLYEALAQHYGLETSWLDITNDFNVALFFATCYWDNGEWKPLTKEQTEVDDNHKYGMIFHMPSNRMTMRWSMALPKFSTFSNNVVGKTLDGKDKYEHLIYPRYEGDVDNLIYPLGFQPFMRCHMQNGYGIYMRTPHPLQDDIEFEKLRFRHSEELSRKVFDMMHGGKLIYPQEGLKQAEFIIEQIRKATSFSEEAFKYALYRSHYYKMENEDAVKKDLMDFMVNGQPILIGSKYPWRLTPGRRNRIDSLYNDFDVEKNYGIKIMDRKCFPGPNPMFEPWMIPEENDGDGIIDFQTRERVNCGMSIVSRDIMNILATMMTAKLQDF